MALALDDERERVIGRGWKHRALGGRSVHQLMNDVPRHSVFHMRLRMEEGMVVARCVIRSGLNRNSFLRRAVAHWLITKEGVDRSDIPHLAKDL